MDGFFEKHNSSNMTQIIGIALYISKVIECTFENSPQKKSQIVSMEKKIRQIFLKSTNS